MRGWLGLFFLQSQLCGCVTMELRIVLYVRDHLGVFCKNARERLHVFT